MAAVAPLGVFGSDDEELLKDGAGVILDMDKARQLTAEAVASFVDSICAYAMQHAARDPVLEKVVDVLINADTLTPFKVRNPSLGVCVAHLLAVAVLDDTVQRGGDDAGNRLKMFRDDLVLALAAPTNAMDKPLGMVSLTEQLIIGLSVLGDISHVRDRFANNDSIPLAYDKVVEMVRNPNGAFEKRRVVFWRLLGVMQRANAAAISVLEPQILAIVLTMAGNSVELKAALITLVEEALGQLGRRERAVANALRKEPAPPPAPAPPPEPAPQQRRDNGPALWRMDAYGGADVQWANTVLSKIDTTALVTVPANAPIPMSRLWHGDW
jgi:hypothetical protein